MSKGTQSWVLNWPFRAIPQTHYKLTLQIEDSKIAYDQIGHVTRASIVGPTVVRS
jgi:hypothetical protein